MSFIQRSASHLLAPYQIQPTILSSELATIPEPYTTFSQPSLSSLSRPANHYQLLVAIPELQYNVHSAI
jgi:hypothetical protein